VVGVGERGTPHENSRLRSQLKQIVMKKNPALASVRWVMHPSDRGQLTQLEGGWDEEIAPAENEVITRPFLVDSNSKNPVPVRVVQRLEWHHTKKPTFVVVVRRAA
jgi:type II secretory pathway component PulJ